MAGITEIPLPDSYVRYFSFEANPPGWRYIHLLEAEGPLNYPFRFPSLAPGAKQSSATTIDEPRPKEFDASQRNHLYLALLGLWPGFRYYIFHPFDNKRLSFDLRIINIDTDLTANLTYDDSPHDAPVFQLWISNKRYPAFQPLNIGIKAQRPQIKLVMTRYRILTHAQIDTSVIARLSSGQLPSLPIVFGGEF